MRTDRKRQQLFETLLRGVGRTSASQWFEDGADTSEYSVALVADLKVLVSLKGLVNLEDELARLNKLLDDKQRNVFRYLLLASVFMMSPVAATREADVWGEVAKYPREDWRHEVSNNDTSLGYWEWVAHQIEVHGEESDEPE